MTTCNYKRLYRFKLYLYSLLSIAASVFLLWVNSLYNWQADWTSNHRNTLSPSSIELLQRMDQPVSLQAYFTSENKNRLQVSRFINKYQRFKQDISHKFVDTQLPTEELIKLGFTQLGQLKISYADRHIFINRLTEKEMTAALFQLARNNDTWIAAIQGHGERDPLNTGNNGLSKLVAKLNASAIKVQSINLAMQSFIPDNTRILLIAGPRNAYLGSELKLIENFLNNGGNLLWLRDPIKQNYFSSLDELLGIEPIPGIVIDANTTLRILLGIKHVAVIPITEFHKHSITAQLESHLLFPFAAALQHRTHSDWKTQTLFNSLQRSWAEVGEINTDKLTYEQEQGDTQGPLALGLALSRQVNEKQQRVVIIGDSDFIANGYIGHGANFALALNIFNWLSEDDKLISITHQAIADQTIELEDKDVMYIALILLLLVPGALIGTGFGIHWWRHKH